MVRTSAGRLYVAGSTSNAALDAIVTTAHHGDLDGYVLSLQDNGASASAQFVSYTGTLFEDHINGIALDAANGNDVYVTGDTDYVFTGEGDINDNVDAFYSRISATGVLELVQQYSGGTGADRKSTRLNSSHT